MSYRCKFMYSISQDRHCGLLFIAVLLIDNPSFSEVVQKFIVHRESKSKL